MDEFLVKENVIMKLISKNGIEKLPDQFPKDEFLDLLIGYRIVGRTPEGRIFTYPLFYENMEKLDVEEDELKNLALSNIKNHFKTAIYSLKAYAEQKETGKRAENLVNNEELPRDILLLTTEPDLYGAAFIMDEALLKSIGEKIEDSYYVLPSSIHELILVPKSVNNNVSWLKAMVRQVNRNSVTVGDFLSDSIYFFDRKKAMVLRVA